MKKTSVSFLIVSVFAISGLLCPPRARAEADASSSIFFNNLLISPASGSLQFTTDWNVQAYAQAGGNSVLVQGTATTVLTNASDTFAYGFGEAVSTHPPTNNVWAQGNSSVAIPGQVTAQDSATGDGTLDGMLLITGGTGQVSTTFSVLRSANLGVNTDQYGLQAQTETTFLLNINGSSILSDYNLLSIGPDSQDSFSVSSTLATTDSLQYNTEYWIHLEVDSESECVNIPEPSASDLLVAGLVVSAWGATPRRLHPRGSSRKGRNVPGGWVLLCALVCWPLAVPAKYIAADPPQCCPCQTCGGAPASPAAPVSQVGGGSSISLTEGNLTDTYPVTRLGNASGNALNLFLTYNSYNADSSRAYVNTVMGLGWTHSYNVFLFEQAGSMFFMDGVGRVEKFQAAGRGTYQATTGYFEKLVQNPDGTFTLTNAELTAFNFAHIPNTPFLVQGNVYRLTSMVDRNQNTTSLSYSNGNLVAITDAYGRSVTIGYHSNLLQTVTDPLGRTTTLQYNAGGSQLLQVTDPAGQSVHYRYNFMNQLIAKTNKNGLAYTYLYTNLVPVAIVDPAGQALFSLTNAANWGVNPTNVALNMTRDYSPSTTIKTDGRSNVWLFTYENHGYLTQITAPDLTSTLYYYDPTTLRVAGKVDGNGGVTAYGYDANGNVTHLTDALGNVTTYMYDPVLNLQIRMTDPNGYVTRWQYDGYGNRTNETDALGYTRAWTYDAHGNVLTATDKNGNVTHNFYDPFGNCTNTTDALGHITAFTYDVVGNLLSRTDANLNVSTYTYDVLNQLIATTNGLSVSDSPGALFTAKVPALSITAEPDGSFLLNWTASGFTLTQSRDLTRAFEAVLANGQPVTNSPFEISAPVTNACEFYCLRATTALIASPGNGLPTLRDKSQPAPQVTLYTYDADGNRTSDTDANGHTTTYAYDVRDRLISVTNALGHITACTYDADDNKVSQTDANGHSIWYFYDSQNRLASNINALGCVAVSVYDPVGNQISATDADGHSSTFGYDPLNRQITQTNALGYVTQYAYDAPLGAGGCGCGAGTKGTSHIVKQTDANGKVTYCKYDPLGRLLKTIRKQGDTTDVITTNDAMIAYTYDPNGNMLMIVDPNKITNCFGYDSLNRMVAATNGAGDVTLTSYDPAGNLVTIADPNGNVSTNTYDSLNRLIQIDDLLGRVASYTYDGVGNRLSNTDGNTNTTLYAYDPLNRLVTTTDAMGNSSLNVYDPVGNRIKVLDRNGHPTLYAYDPLNRQTNSENALGCITTSAYDCVGNLLALTDANNHSTSYQYDALNRKVRETYPDSVDDTCAFTYDGVGNLASRTDQKGNTTVYKYSDFYYVTNRIYASDSADRFTYDLAGRMLTASKTNWLTTNDWVVTFAYDAAGRITNTTQGGRVLRYSYNVPGRTRSIRYPCGTNIVELTDARGRLSTVNDGSVTATAAYRYDLGNRVFSRTYRSGALAEYAYNPDNWITSLIHTNQAATNLIAGFAYAYDKEGNKYYEQDIGNPNRSEADAYDPLYRLTNWVAGQLVGGTVPVPANTQAWQLDCLGDWRVATANNVTEYRTHDAANEIGTIQTGAHSMVPIYYDANGNLTNDGSYAYVYDNENRLVSVTRLFLIPGDTAPRVVGQYGYDALGRRTAKIANADAASPPSTIVYLYNAARVIEEQSAGGATLAAYEYGNYVDEVLAMLRSGGTYFYHQNSIWSVVAVSDSAMNPVERYAYDPYGWMTITDGAGAATATNAWGTAHSVVGNSYMFTGRQADEETGLYFYRLRYLDSQKGRFQQRDLWEYADTMNLYEYAKSNPANRVDPAGLDGWLAAFLSLGMDEQGALIWQHWVEGSGTGLVIDNWKQYMESGPPPFYKLVADRLQLKAMYYCNNTPLGAHKNYGMSEKMYASFETSLPDEYLTGYGMLHNTVAFMIQGNADTTVSSAAKCTVKFDVKYTWYKMIQPSPKYLRDSALAWLISVFASPKDYLMTISWNGKPTFAWCMHTKQWFEETGWPFIAVPDADP